MLYYNYTRAFARQKSLLSSSKELFADSTSNMLACCVSNSQSLLVFSMDIRISGLFHKFNTSGPAKFKGYSIDNAKRTLFGESARIFE